MVTTIILWSFITVVTNITAFLKFITTFLLVQVLLNQKVLKADIVNIFENIISVKTLNENDNNNLNRKLTLSLNNTKHEILRQYDDRVKKLQWEYTKMQTEFERLLEQRKIDYKNQKDYQIELFDKLGEVYDLRMNELTTSLEATVEVFRERLQIFEKGLDLLMLERDNTLKESVLVKGFFELHSIAITKHINYLNSGKLEDLESTLEAFQKIKKLIDKKDAIS